MRPPILDEFKARRKALGISQEVFANAAGISLNTIAKLECGLHNNPTLEMLTKIESALSRLEAERAAQATGTAEPMKAVG